MTDRDTRMSRRQELIDQARALVGECSDIYVVVDMALEQCPDVTVEQVVRIVQLTWHAAPLFALIEASERGAPDSALN